MLVALALALGLLLSPAVTNVGASPDETEWEQVVTPTGEDWKLAPGTDELCNIMGYKGVYYFAGGQIFGIGLTAGGGELYVVGLFRDVDDLNDNDNICEIVPQLLKSTDGGATWTAKTDKVLKELEDEGVICAVKQKDWMSSAECPTWNDPVRHMLFERVACDPLNADFVIVQVAFDNLVLGPMDPEERWAPRVLISDDNASSFKDTGEVAQAGWYLSVAHSLATTVETDDEHDIAISGIASNNTHTRGAVFRFVTGLAPGWVDATRYDGWDDAPNGYPQLGPMFQSMAVVTVRYGVDFVTHGTVLVTTVDAYNPTGTPVGDIYLQAGTWGKTEAWNGEAGFASAVRLKKDVVIYPIQTGVAGITLPLDSQWRYASKRYAWVNVNYGTNSSDPWNCDYQVGEILRVVDYAVSPIIQQIPGRPWLGNVAYWGYIESGKAVAGVFGTGCALPYWVYVGNRAVPVFTPCCEGVQVFRNDAIEDMDICCKGWKDSCKPPTGRGSAAAFFVSDTKALALVARSPYDSAFDESALSVSFDDGETWNQLSLIDTHIDFLSDVAVSPNCNKHMLVSINVDDEDCQTCCGSYMSYENEPGWWYNDYDDCDWPDSSMYGWYGPGVIGITYPCPYEYPTFACDHVTACDSVWLMADDLAEAEEYSGTWLRTWCGVLEEDYGLLRLAPEEENGETVYLVDWLTDTVYWNDMETLACWEVGHALVDEIHDLAVMDEATIYALDTNGDVAMSDDHGATASWDDPVASKLDNGHTIAVKGDQVLVGGEKADVSMSDDGGETFTELDRIDCCGDVHVAFDCYSDQNDTIYAAIAYGSNGVYRWVIDESTKWKDLGASNILSYTGVVVDNPDGNPMTDATTGCVLYASFIDGEIDVDAMEVDVCTGVARVLNPAMEVCCGEADWSYLIQTAACDEYWEGELYDYDCPAFALEPSALKICGCLEADSTTHLWAIDSWSDGYPGYYDRYCCCPEYEWCCGCWEEPYWLDCDCACIGRLWTYEDCFSKGAPGLVAPSEGAMIAADECYCWNEDVILKWERMCNACSYDVQVALDEDFNDVVWQWLNYDPWKDRRASAAEPSVVITEGELDCATTFYWRVRVSDAETGEYIYSWWSEARSFTVEVGPLAAITLTAPDNGVTNVPLTGISFTWTEVTDASTYDWVLSANADLSGPVESKTGLAGTAYTFTLTLEHNTAYYWRVTAMKDGVVIS